MVPSLMGIAASETGCDHLFTVQVHHGSLRVSDSLLNLFREEPFEAYLIDSSKPSLKPIDMLF